MVKVDASRSRGRGLDVSDASYYIQEINENKGSRMGQTKKKNIF